MPRGESQIYVLKSEYVSEVISNNISNCIKKSEID